MIRNFKNAVRNDTNGIFTSEKLAIENAVLKCANFTTNAAGFVKKLDLVEKESPACRVSNYLCTEGKLRSIKESVDASVGSVQQTSLEKDLNTILTGMRKILQRDVKIIKTGWH